MHANDGSLAENWIIERGGWQLDRVNKAFGYMLGSTQADQSVARTLSGWNPKEGARLPSLRSLEQPIRDRARALMASLFTCSLGFDDSSLNLDEDVAECLAATLFMNFSDLLLLAENCALISRMREAMSARTIGEAEILAWGACIRLDFDPPREKNNPLEPKSDVAEVLEVLKEQSKQIHVLTLQNKRLEERQLAMEMIVRSHFNISVHDEQPNTGLSQASVTPQTLQQAQQTVRPKKKGSQTLSAVWYEWFTAEPRVYVSRSVKKNNSVRV